MDIFSADNYQAKNIFGTNKYTHVYMPVSERIQNIQLQCWNDFSVVWLDAIITHSSSHYG